MSKRGLGKGLDALLSTSSFAREKQHIASHSQELSADGELTDLAIGQLQPGVYQPRKDMAPEALEELAASIQSQGIIQPIVVRQVESGQFEIIAGERRWRAARQAGLKRVPCLVKKATVVLPVPTSPVSMAKPPPSPNPALRCVIASL